MRYVILHGDGMAGFPYEDVGGKTFLQAANTSNMDNLARRSEFGLAVVPADSLVPNSDIVELAVLGYDPRKQYPGPAPFEALGLGVAVEEHDIVYRCNMVTLRNVQPGKGSPTDVKKLGPSVIMEDATAGGLDTEEARELIDAINEQLGSEAIQFYQGGGHRHLMVWVNGKARANCVDPQEVVGKSVAEYLPTGDGSDILRKLMEASLIILRDHPVNDQRRREGLKPANCLWLWGQGRAPQLTSLTDRYQITGTIISTSDVHKGIGISAGLEAIDVSLPSETGSTDFLNKAEAALRELGKKDFVYVHAQMPSDVLFESDLKARLKVVEEFDTKVVGTLVSGLTRMGAYRLLLVCDYAIQPGTRPSAAFQVPYMLYESQKEKAGKQGFSEGEAETTQAAARDATKLIGRLLARG